MASYKAPIAKRKWQKQQEDIEKLVTPDDVCKFDRSSTAREAISILGNKMEKTSSCATQAEYCLVRDFLLTSICINNACRAGPIANMTLGEFRKAVADETDMVVTVFQHKTLESHGPVNVVLTETIYKWMKVFVASMRHRIPGVSPRDDSNVFLTWSGKEMTSSMVSSQINSCWQKAMGKPGERVNAASFRKASVTIVHAEHPHLKKDLADLMSHNPETANKFYNIRQKGKKAAETSRELSRIMRQTNQERVTETNDHHEESTTSSRHKWEVKELEALKCIFADNIQKGCISVNEVREKVPDTILEGLAIEKVRDKIRDEIKAKPQVEKSIPLPTEVESLEKKVERMDEEEAKTLSLFTSNSSQLSSRVFTDEQTKMMYELFPDLIFSNASIGTKEVQRRINNHPQAKKTIVGFTPLQLCSKIRTERKRTGRQAPANM